MEQEFEDFFLHCQKLTNSNHKEMMKILEPLRVHLWKQQLKKVLKMVLAVASICCAIYYVDTFNWYFCAVARIAMIKLLTIWNWTYLANAKCLVSKAEASSKNDDGFRSLSEKDCRACEHFGKKTFTWFVSMLHADLFCRSNRCSAADDLQFHSWQVSDPRLASYCKRCSVKFQQNWNVSAIHRKHFGKYEWNDSGGSMQLGDEFDDVELRFIRRNFWYSK